MYVEGVVRLPTCGENIYRLKRQMKKCPNCGCIEYKMVGNSFECISCHTRVEKVPRIPLKQIDFIKWAENLELQINRGEIDLPLNLVSSHIKRICRERGYDFWYIQNINAKLPGKYKNPKYMRPDIAYWHQKDKEKLN